MKPPSALAAGAAIVYLAYLLPLTFRLLRWAQLRGRNFRGDEIPLGFGLYIILGAAPILATVGIRDWGASSTGAYIAAVAGFGLLGFIDDRFGDRSARGLRGHILALVRHRRVTTGLVKAGGGIALALAIPALFLGRELPDVLLDGAVIALSANALNLLDLRPGRACATFLLSAVAFLATGRPELAGLVVVTLAALVVYPLDASAVVMLGDTGANALGAVLGLCIVLVGAAPAKAAALVLLAALHLAAEKYSLTEIIQRSRVLRALDGLTGVRE